MRRSRQKWVYDRERRARWVYPLTCETDVDALFRPCFTWCCSDQKYAGTVENAGAGPRSMSWPCCPRFRIAYFRFLGPCVTVTKQTVFARKRNFCLRYVGRYTHFCLFPFKVTRVALRSAGHAVSFLSQPSKSLLTAATPSAR